MKQLGAGKSECRAEENTGHRGEERATLSFSRVSDPPDGIKAETSAKRHAAAVREAAVLLEAAGVAVDYIYMPEGTK